MSAEQTGALEVLRDVWRGQSQGVGDGGLDGCETRACKKMTEAGVGFDDFGGETAEARMSSWRARLEREGKLDASGGSLRDIVFGTGAAR
jgi:hypothetical protein